MTKQKKNESWDPFRLVTGVQKGVGILSNFLGGAGKKNPKLQEMKKRLDSIGQEIERRFKNHVASSKEGKKDED